MNSFSCLYCEKQVPLDELIGTLNRNHCPSCLWSKHVDLEISGDRKSTCGQGMVPIGLTFKIEGKDKWGRKKQGELMLVHECCGCGKISINRIAGDDNPEEILKILSCSKDLNTAIKDELKQKGIKLLTENDLTEIKTQLYGNKQ